MNTWVIAPNHISFIKMPLTSSDVHGMLGDFKTIKLLSDDIMCVQTEPIDEVNELGSILLNRPVRGNILVLDQLL